MNTREQTKMIVTEREQKIQTLKEIQQLDGLIIQKMKQLAAVRRAAASVNIDYSADKIQNPGPSDKVGESVVQIIELERYIDSLIDQYVDLKWQIMKRIDRLDDLMERAILNGRYVDGLTWRKIAELFQTRISRQWLSKRHNDAVDHLDLSDIKKSL